MVDWDKVCKMFEQGKNGKYANEKYNAKRYLPLLQKLYELKSMKF
jgi:negative regulator of replication initiation